MKLKKLQGMALIEVLIALAILSIALTAIIKASSQNIKDTLYLEDKTLAYFVGLNAVNQIRLDLIAVSDAEPAEQETITLGKVWHWQAYVKPSRNEHIQEIRVDVFRRSEEKKLISLLSYRYVSE